MATMLSCKVDGQSSLQTQKAATPLQQAPAVSRTTLGAQLPSLHFSHPEGFLSRHPSKSTGNSLKSARLMELFLPHREDFQQRFNL